MATSSFNRLTIDTVALEHNWRLIKSRVAALVTVLAMAHSTMLEGLACGSSRQLAVRELS